MGRGFDSHRAQFIPILVGWGFLFSPAMDAGQTPVPDNGLLSLLLTLAARPVWVAVIDILNAVIGALRSLHVDEPASAKFGGSADGVAGGSVDSSWVGRDAEGTSPRRLREIGIEKALLSLRNVFGSFSDSESTKC